MKEGFAVANVYLARWKRLVEKPSRISEFSVQILGPTDAQTAHGVSVEAVKRGERVAISASDEVPIFELLVSLGWPRIYHWL